MRIIVGSVPVLINECGKRVHCWFGSGSLALAQHLRHQLDELTLRALIVLLQRTPESRLSAADLRFLRPPGAPPLATAVLPLPSSLGDGATASTGNLESTAQAPMLAWLRAAGGRLRPVGWHPLSLAHASGETSNNSLKIDERYVICRKRHERD